MTKANEENRYQLNKELAQMLKGGVIMDVTTPEQAKIAEAAGACAVMALERIPADIRAAGGVARMSDPGMIRTKGEPGTGDVVQAVHHLRKINAEMSRVASLRTDELFEAAKEYRVPVELIEYVHDHNKLPVVNFAAGGVATPADAALMMQLGAEGVFVGSGIFKSGNPEKRAAAIVQAVTNFKDAKLIAKLSENLGEAMVGINAQEIEILMAERGK